MQLSSSPVSAQWAHVRLATLLALVVAGAGALLALAAAFGLPQGKDTFAFMAAEVSLSSRFALFSTVFLTRLLSLRCFSIEDHIYY